MSAKELWFYATKKDIIEAFQGIKDGDDDLELKFVLDGLFEHAEPEIFYDIRDLPNLGNAINDSYSIQTKYLILRKNDRFCIEHVPQIRGKIPALYSIDIGKIPQAIAFGPAGVVDKMLICGTLGRGYDYPLSDPLYNILARVLRKTFEKNNRVYVGNGAKELVRSGYRMTMHPHMSPETDDILV